MARATAAEARARLVKIDEDKRGKRRPKMRGNQRQYPFHISLYINHDVYREIKRIAIDEDCRPHDILMDILKDGLMKEYALNYSAIAGKG